MADTLIACSIVVCFPVSGIDPRSSIGFSSIPVLLLATIAYFTSRYPEKVVWIHCEALSGMVNGKGREC